MKIFLFIIYLFYPFVLFAQQTKPTPSFNLLTYKIAELYKRAGDEHYIENDLTLTSPVSGNYDTEKELYKKAAFYSSSIDNNLLFNDPEYRRYCDSIGLDTTNTLLLFNDELDYRFGLAERGEPFFVFDKRKTLEDFDINIPSDIEFYYSQLKSVDSAIDVGSAVNLKLQSVLGATIRPSDADAQAEIKVAEENINYFQQELEYHRSIVERYNGLLTASIERQKSISASIQKDLKELDDLSKANTGLLASALSSYAGIPNVSDVTNFIQNPDLKQAINLTLSNSGSKFINTLGETASWSKEAVEAYQTVKGVYDAGKKYYETAKEVVQFVQHPDLGHFISAANKIAAASGRSDLSQLASQLEKGKNLWNQIMGCAGNFDCGCFETALNTTGQLPDVKKYLDTLKKYNFNCNTVKDLQSLIDNPSFSNIEEFASNFPNVTGNLTDDLKSWKNLKDSLDVLSKHSGFEKYLEMGEKIGKQLSSADYDKFKTEVLNNKPLGLLYDILLSENKDYGKLLIKNLLPDNGDVNTQRLKKFLTDLINEKNITAGRFFKELFKAYPEIICDVLPVTLSDQLRSVVSPAPPNCKALIGDLNNSNAVFHEIVFEDSVLILRDKTITYDFKNIVTNFISKILDNTHISSDLKPLVKDFIMHEVPAIKGKIDLSNPISQQRQASLFNAAINSNEIDETSINKIKNQLTQTSLGLYGFGKLKSNPDFQAGLNSSIQLDTIAKYDPVIGNASQLAPANSNQDLLQNFLIQGAVNYFAPGAMQALTIVSNLLLQGQIADQVREKNKELQEEVRDYVDKGLEKDKYNINLFRAQHEVTINTLIAKGKRAKKDALENAESQLQFRRQLLKNQVNDYSSYYYYLLERLRESFTEYLWAYRTWYGTSYQKELLKNPNNVRLILDPQIRYLTFFNYSNLGIRKGTEVLRQWQKIIPTLIQKHKDFIINRKNEENLSPFSANMEDIAPDSWSDFNKWIITNQDDTLFKIKLSIDLLNKSSTDKWTIGQGDKLQRKLIDGNPNDDFPIGFRLLGINVLLIDNNGHLIDPGLVFISFDLKLDSAYASVVNYSDKFTQESYPKESIKEINIRNFPTLEQEISGVNIKYFKALWGVPLQSGFVLSMRKNTGTIASQELRKKIKNIQVKGFYFTNQKSNFSRSISSTGSFTLKVDGISYKVPFPLTSVLKNTLDSKIIEVKLKELQDEINKP